MESLKKEANEFCERFGELRNASEFLTNFVQSLITAGKLMEALEWISVKDRLPEKHARVQISEKTKGLTEPSILQGSWEGNRWRIYGGDTAENVTHWMPLLAAPGEPTLSSAGKEVMQPYIRGCRECADSDGMCDTYANQYCDPDAHKKELLKQQKQFKSPPASTEQQRRIIVHLRTTMDEAIELCNSYKTERHNVTLVDILAKIVDLLTPDIANKKSTEPIEKIEQLKPVSDEEINTRYPITGGEGIIVKNLMKGQRSAAKWMREQLTGK